MFSDLKEEKMKKRIPVCLLLILLALWGISFGDSPQAAVIYVTETGGGTGTVWESPADLQAAIAKANPGDEIWVKKGTYTPHASSRSVSFQLKSGVGIYGGFSGTESVKQDRDWTANETILSGDIGKAGDNTDNSYHVVTGSDADSSTVIDGFTITKGYGDGEETNSYGAGMYNSGASPLVENCIFIGNAVNNSGNGAGMCNDNSSHPTILNCAFIGNTGYISAGGGMASLNASNPSVSNCSFIGNTANSGGGMFNLDSSNPVVANCVFSGNTSETRGGGIFNWGSSPTITNCTFNANAAGTRGGGIANLMECSPKIFNSIFWNNTAAEADNEINPVKDAIHVAYCLIEGGYASGINIIDGDPQFADADGNDNKVGTTDDDLHLQGNSPAIDAGDNMQVYGTADLDGKSRRSYAEKADTGNGTPPIVDIGAYEYGAESLLEGDMTCDRVINLGDVLLGLRVLAGESRDICNADMNGDKRVGMEDMILLLKDLAK